MRCAPSARVRCLVGRPGPTAGIVPLAVTLEWRQWVKGELHKREMNRSDLTRLLVANGCAVTRSAISFVLDHATRSVMVEPINRLLGVDHEAPVVQLWPPPELSTREENTALRDENRRLRDLVVKLMLERA